MTTKCGQFIFGQEKLLLRLQKALTCAWLLLENTVDLKVLQKTVTRAIFLVKLRLHKSFHLKKKNSVWYSIVQCSDENECNRVVSQLISFPYFCCQNCGIFGAPFRVPGSIIRHPIC